MERRYWPGGDALGKMIYLGAPKDRVFDDAVIVGIVKDVKQRGLDESMLPVHASGSLTMRDLTPSTSTRRRSHGRKSLH